MQQPTIRRCSPELSADDDCGEAETEANMSSVPSTASTDGLASGDSQSEAARDDYEGDHYVPKHGLEQAKQFEIDRQGGHWELVFDEVAPDMQRIYESTSDSYASAADKGWSCCTVADPTLVDCGLVWISRGFEELTGYKREWALGRNCRFLQPNSRPYNDSLNLSERELMRDWCRLPPKKGRLLSLVVNEHRDGYPFWNALLMKHIIVNGHRYIFGVQTSVVRHRRVLAELLAGGGGAILELNRLRSVLRSLEARLETYSLDMLLNEAIEKWMASITSYFSPPRMEILLLGDINLPIVGVEIWPSELAALQDKLLSSIDEGVRHFHFNFTAQTTSRAGAHQLADMDGKSSALRFMDALAVLRQQHLRYLRDCLVFSFRARPSQVSGCLEFLTFLRSTGLRVCLWLLDVSTVGTAEVAELWPEMDAAVRRRLVEGLGIYGGGPAEFAAAGGSGLTKPSILALDFYIGVQLSCRQWVHLNKVSRAGVTVMTCKPFGAKDVLLSDGVIRNISKEQGVDPTMLLLKWAEGAGYLCVTPWLRSRPGPATLPPRKLSESKFALEPSSAQWQGCSRTFVREYAAAPPADRFLEILRRRMPAAALDQRTARNAVLVSNRNGTPLPFAKQGASSSASRPRRTSAQNSSSFATARRDAYAMPPSRDSRAATPPPKARACTPPPARVGRGQRVLQRGFSQPQLRSTSPTPCREHTPSRRLNVVVATTSSPARRCCEANHAPLVDACASAALRKLSPNPPSYAWASTCSPLRDARISPLKAELAATVHTDAVFEDDLARFDDIDDILELDDAELALRELELEQRAWEQLMDGEKQREFEHRQKHGFWLSTSQANGLGT